MRNLLLNSEESIRNERPLRVTRLLLTSQPILLVGEHGFKDQGFSITAGTSSSLNISSISGSSTLMALNIGNLCYDGVGFAI
jgi:hypothetical protein